MTNSPIEEVILYESYTKKKFKNEFIVRQYYLLVATLEEHQYKYQHFNKSLG